ncbi:MAG: EAL domain-containing protein [Devosia sp.]|uniref:EAL domain-containing protein n=1 Tax=Devosia sp. TaxID=1871048 RepID=UPI0024CC783F|nr:EAL domain-containing protein [Devosia sp.]UYN99491.1 MAG: EAL domain-containing protein [Devosia sp.]
MQALVYLFIALAGAGFGALAYFGLAFTPATAILVGLVFSAIGVIFMERVLRQRAENRLEKAIQDLSRLLATDAQAGAVLGQRINALTDLNPGQRLETVEADISVLGTVIRQVAEAVAEMEDKAARNSAAPAAMSVPRAVEPTALRPPPAAPAEEPGPAIPLEMLRQALEENRLVFHIQPIVRLPQRRPVAYELVPRLMLEDGELAGAVDFMPRRKGGDLVVRIEAAALVEAIAIARRSRTGGQPVTLYLPLSGASLDDEDAAEQLLAVLDANRSVAPGLVFLVTESDWSAMSPRQKSVAAGIARKGAGFSIAAMRSLRADMADLAASGVRSLRVDGARFIETPETYTDFHVSDISGYLKRFEIQLIVTNIAGERQIVELLDSDITLVQGDYLAPPGPVRPDLSFDSQRSVGAQPARRAESL